MNELKNYVEQLLADAEKVRDKHPVNSWQYDQAIGEIKVCEKILEKMG